MDKICLFSCTTIVIAPYFKVVLIDYGNGAGELGRVHYESEIMVHHRLHVGFWAERSVYVVFNSKPNI